MKIISLQLETSSSFEKNLDLLIEYYLSSSDSQVVVAPEVFLTGFSYDRFEEAAEFSVLATNKLLQIVGKTALIFTMIEKIDGVFVNSAKVFYEHQIIHTQQKYKLFLLGNEHKYFNCGEKNKIITFDLLGIKVAILICFELRFKDLWQQIEGADLIIIPSAWGKPRKEHLEILSKALAIVNRAFVVVSNSSNFDMASSSAIISPFGISYIDDNLKKLFLEIDLKEIKKIKKYIPYQ